MIDFLKKEEHVISCPKDIFAVFSLSRMTTNEERCEIYNNLAEDPNLFICEGQEHDPPGDYQFDIYRYVLTLKINILTKFGDF